MRITAYILCIITLSLCLSGCKNVIQSESDEIIYYSWYVHNQSGIKAHLSFDTDNQKCSLQISENSQSDVKIEGVFSIDKNNIYIYDADVLNVFVFEYDVYSDRLILKYKGEEIELIKKDCAEVSDSPDDY